MSLTASMSETDEMFQGVNKRAGLCALSKLCKLQVVSKHEKSFGACQWDNQKPGVHPSTEWACGPRGSRILATDVFYTLPVRQNSAVTLRSDITNVIMFCKAMVMFAPLLNLSVYDCDVQKSVFTNSNPTGLKLKLSNLEQFQRLFEVGHDVDAKEFSYSKDGIEINGIISNSVKKVCADFTNVH